MNVDKNTIAPLDDDSKVVLEDASLPPASEEAPASPPAETGEGDSPEPEAVAAPEPEAPAPKVSNRDALIAKLTGVAEDEPAPTAEDEAPPEVPAEAPPKPEAVEKPKTPEVPVDDDLKETTNDDIKAMKPGEARRKINRLVTRYKEAAPLAAGFKEIVELCEKNGFTPDDYRAWVNIGIGLQQNDEAAIAKFAEVAAKIGITATPAEVAPALTPELDAWLAAQTKDLEMSPTAAAELRKRLSAAPAPTPAALATRQPTPPPAAPQRTAPDPILVARTRATSEINRIADEYEKRIGADNFAALEPRIMAELAKRKGKHPDAWADTFRSVVEIELAKVPKPAAIGSTIRPGGGNPPPAKPAFKTERERIIHQYAG